MTSEVSAGVEGDVQGIWDYYTGNCEDVSVVEPGPTYSQSQFTVKQDLSSRIWQNHKDGYTYSTIDGVVHVRTLNAAKRTEKVDYWKARRMERITLGGLGGVGTLVAFINGAAATNPLGWMALGAGALALTIFGIYKATQAHDQIGKWNQNLPEVVAHKRQVAFDQGLLYIMGHDQGKTERSFRSLLSVVEMQGIYHDFFKGFAEGMRESLEGRERVNAVKAAANHSPLAPHVMDYGKLFPYQKEVIKYYIDQYQAFLHAFNSVESRRREMERNTHNTANAQISEIEREKEQACTFVYATYNIYAEKARQDFVEALKARPEGVSKVEHEEQAERDYQDSLRQARLLRDAGIRMVSHPFERRVEEVQRTRDEYLREIKFNFDAKLLPFFSHVALLHKDAYLTFIGQGPSIYPNLQDPNELFEFQPPVFRQPVPSAPPYEEVFGHARDEAHVDPEVYRGFMGAYRDQYGHRAG